jgi:DNA primase
MAKKEIAKKRQVVIVEGYTDVMAAHLAGVTTAVATCGTAFGDDHIKVIRQLLMDDDAFRGEVIFTFDGDAAGQKAALKAFEDDQKFVAQTFVAVEESGMDPCELRIAKGDEAVRDLIARRVPLFQFAIKSEIAKHNMANAEGRVNALNQVAPLINKIKDASLRPEYTKLLAGWLGMDVDIVAGAVKKSNPRGGAQSSQPTQPAQSVNFNDPILVLEREVLKIKLQYPSLIPNWNELEANAFSYEKYGNLAKELTHKSEPDAAKFIDSLQDEAIKSLVTELIVEPIRVDREISEKYVTSVFARLREVAITRSIAEIKSKLQRLNPVENADEYQAIFTELVGMEGKKRAQKELAVGELG